MIFVTVGTQLPFSRLLNYVNKWASISGEEVFAQVGDDSSIYNHIVIKNYITESQMLEYIVKSKVIVAHAGIGSIITAMDLNKPIIIVPRLSKYKEHRNDHQLATVNKFSNVRGVYVANSEHELFYYLNNLEELNSSSVSAGVSHSLIDFLSHVVR